MSGSAAWESAFARGCRDGLHGLRENDERLARFKRMQGFLDFDLLGGAQMKRDKGEVVAQRCGQKAPEAKQKKRVQNGLPPEGPEARLIAAQIDTARQKGQLSKAKQKQTDVGAVRGERECI
jgi:hypothetical protein